MRMSRRVGIYVQGCSITYLSQQLDAINGSGGLYPAGATNVTNAVVTVDNEQISASLTNVGSTNGYWCCCFCQTPIDLTRRRRMIVTVKRYGHENAILNLYLTNTAGNAFPAQKLSVIPYPSTDWTDVEWDVSTLSGNHYIALGLHARAAAPSIYGYIQKVVVR